MSLITENVYLFYFEFRDIHCSKILSELKNDTGALFFVVFEP